MTSVYLATSEEIEVSGRYFADCGIATAPIWATRSSKASKLWEVSETMTKCTDQNRPSEVLSC